MQYSALVSFRVSKGTSTIVEGDRGVGDWEKRGWEVYRGQEKRGQEVGFPNWWEAGEKGEIIQHCTIFCNRKIAKRREATTTGQEPGLKGAGSGRFKPPVPPPPPPPHTHTHYKGRIYILHF